MVDPKYRRYRERHPEKVKAANRRWRLKNLEAQRKRERENRRKRYECNRDWILFQNRLWASENRDSISARDARRRARKRNATLGDPRIISEWKQKIRKLSWVRCHWCGTKVPGRKVHFDHVIALNLNGAESIDNLCTSCPECNCRKKDQPLTKWTSKGQKFLSL